MSLIFKRCIPCQAGIAKFTKEQVNKLLAQIQGWTIEGNFNKDTKDKLIKNYKFKNFKEAIAFVNKVADLAEEERHHPNINIHSWNKVRIELYTHAIGGLCENDFILAAKIDTLE